MDEDEVTHLADLMVHAALMGAVVLTVAVVMVAALAVTGCAVVIHVDEQRGLVKPADTVEPPAAFTTQDGDSKYASISI